MNGDEMDDVFAKVFAQWGLPGVIILYLVWDKWRDAKIEDALRGSAEKRKLDGTHLAIENMDHKIKEVGDKLAAHLEKKAEEDVMLEGMRKDIERSGDNIRRHDENIEKIFGMVSALKDSLIAMGYGKDKHPL